MRRRNSLLAFPWYGPDSARRFWAKVGIGKPEECWLWLGAKNNKRGGYGKVRRGSLKAGTSVVILAHRLAYALTHDGKFPQVVRHICDNPPCCNPAHLLAGTQADNVQDRVERGRSGPRSGKNGNARLTWPQVRSLRIRALFYTNRDGFKKMEAARLGVSASTISDILHGRTWKEAQR